ncbi:type II secretion system secretin GspD [Luteimonas aestuarii]|nr:type II secretion system secretin GspD [Luteimonas aestuarii]
MPNPSLKPALVTALVLLLAACATMPPPNVHREGVHAPPRAAQGDGIQAEPLDVDEGPRAQIRRGTGQVINRSAASAPPPNLGGTTGQAEFNFEGESVHAVVKAILGDMLGQNYIIAPGVQGTVTYVTAKPVSPAEALSVLEMVLGWNNARLLYSDGRYNIVPAETAMATGTVAPRTGAATGARGFESRVVPLRYISATEMEKILKPYARPNSIVHVDNGRNVITISGSRAELENYLRTIEIFDVDWLSGMSVGVFPLQSGRAAKVVSDLEKVFGAQAESPVSGMFRFMPLEGANAVMVITPQPDYLDEIEQWLERIDSAGQEARLYSYELKYIKARDLADRLSEVFGGGGGRSSGGGASLMPGLTSGTISDGGMGGGRMDDGMSSQGGLSGGGLGGNSGGLGGGALSLDQSQGGGGSVMLEIDGTRVGVSAVEETNSLLVRTSPGAWRSMRDVIERLDVMPMQVHIEAQVAQVQLSGELEYGVQWFIENHGTQGANLPSTLDRNVNPLIPGNWSTFGGSVSAAGMAWTLFKNDAAAIIRALDSVTDVRLLQTPSVFVRNNIEAQFIVGDRIPVSTVSVNPILGSDSSLTSVQYIETGTILKVRPRVTRDGTVFLEIVQEISAPVGNADANGNFRISQRQLKTEAIAQDGDTIMLAGLINDGVERGSNGIPGLSRIPVIGGLFGTQGSRTERNETIILITARIVRNTQEARDLTDEYGRRFRALEPLYPTRN